MAQGDKMDITRPVHIVEGGECKDIHWIDTDGENLELYEKDFERYYLEFTENYCQTFSTKQLQGCGDTLEPYITNVNNYLALEKKNVADFMKVQTSDKVSTLIIKECVENKG